MEQESKNQLDICCHTELVSVSHPVKHFIFVISSGVEKSCSSKFNSLVISSRVEKSCSSKFNSLVISSRVEKSHDWFYFISIHLLIVPFFFALPKKEPKKSRLIFISLNCYENFLSCARETVSLVPCSKAIAAKFSAITTELKRGRIFPTYVMLSLINYVESAISVSHPV
ncbi:hypothetical protein LX95_01538 [Mesonia algae]|uniref:Uncharacterized protein n=1 Tax=Mesonia algae TaxID=213248 RepID=A0A2W7I5M6_9FLAO|nr:hypothetical protein LX95_01538 [Mesonia algae]